MRSPGPARHHGHGRRHGRRGWGFRHPIKRPGRLPPSLAVDHTGRPAPADGYEIQPG